MPFKLVCVKNIVEIKNMDSSQISYYLSRLSLTVPYYNTYYCIGLFKHYQIDHMLSFIPLFIRMSQMPKLITCARC